jgi:CheY-like chemotaxis protein
MHSLVSDVADDQSGAEFEKLLPIRPILVVDDDAQARKLMETALQSLGYRSVSAAGGEEALRIAATEAPAAVILDLLMPGVDGFEFLDRFKRLTTGQRTPVIVWTAKDLTTEDYDRLSASAQAIALKSDAGIGPLLEKLRLYVTPPTPDSKPARGASVRAAEAKPPTA